MDLLFILAIAVVANFLIKVILFRDLTVDQAQEMIRNGAVIIDVRTDSEYSRANVKQSIHVPLYELKDRIEKVVTDKKKTILLYCRSGSRSFAAKRLLKRMGYENTFNIGSFGRARKITGNN